MSKLIVNEIEKYDAGQLTITTGTNVSMGGALTVTGNLAVDTNTLYVDAANNRVGIGTSSPSYALDINASTAQIQTAGATSLIFRDTGWGNVIIGHGAIGSGQGKFAIGGLSPSFVVDTNNNRVGIGTSSPTSPIDVVSDANATGILLRGRSADSIGTLNFADNAGNVSSQVQDRNGAFWITTVDSSPIVFNTAASERMRIDSSGNVDIANGRLQVNTNSATGAVVRLDYNSTDSIRRIHALETGGGNARPLQIHAQDVRFRDDSSERMRIDSSGNVGIGVSPSQKLHLYNSGTDTYLRVDRGAIQSLFGTDDIGTYIGQQGTYAMRFITNATERMRIGSGGDVLIGKQTYNVNVNGIEFNDAANYSRMTNSVPTGTGNNCYHVYNTSIPTYVFYVQSNGGVANYQANNVNLSDERVKTDIKPLPSYWDKFKALELVTFKYTNQEHNDDNIGLIAQQVESVAPEFVSNDGFAYTSDDEEPLKAIYTTDLYHASMKVLQEAMQKIETLEAKVATLESQLNA